MKKDTALVMSCHAHDFPGTWRISLKWQGNHDISDFELDRIGAVVRSGAETEHTGYVIVFGKAEKITDQDKAVKERLESIRAYVPTSGIPSPAITKMAKLGIVLDDWMRAYELHASAIQCWDSLQHNYGVNVCTLMSMMSENLLPSACEVDVTGVASMYALQLASERAERISRLEQQLWR